jgi:DNA-binding CsgD family transcriptional regulator
MRRASGSRRSNPKPTQESFASSAWEKSLLGLHAALDVESFWTAIQRMLAVAVPSHLLSLTFQHNSILPLLTKSTRPMPDGFWSAEPLAAYVAANSRGKFVRVSDVFPSRRGLMQSAFYRQHLAPQKCLHAVGIFFFKRSRLICVITLLHTPKQGDFASGEMKLLEKLHPQVEIALRRLGSVEREHSVRIALEQFLSRLPLPTILLRWNLKPVYQNRAGRDFCAIWEKGPERSRLTNAKSPMPPEILDRCRLLKKLWAQEKKPKALHKSSMREAQVHHPKWPHLRATLHLKQLNSAGVARPYFLVECEELHKVTHSPHAPTSSLLPHLVRLTSREQEVAWRVCDGRSNQEIADESGLSVQMVKKHLHSIFGKLEVSSRSRLMALMR